MPPLLISNMEALAFAVHVYHNGRVSSMIYIKCYDSNHPMYFVQYISVSISTVPAYLQTYGQIRHILSPLLLDYTAPN